MMNDTQIENMFSDLKTCSKALANISEALQKMQWYQGEILRLAREGAGLQPIPAPWEVTNEPETATDDTEPDISTENGDVDPDPSDAQPPTGSPGEAKPQPLDGGSGNPEDGTDDDSPDVVDDEPVGEGPADPQTGNTPGS